jgi:hypothetical protein
MHLDLRPSGSIEDEVARLEDLGAQVHRIMTGNHVVTHDS